jgi:hypothetical protein
VSARRSEASESAGMPLGVRLELLIFTVEEEEEEEAED